jgi:hypothetical protein
MKEGQFILCMSSKWERNQFILKMRARRVKKKRKERNIWNQFDSMMMKQQGSMTLGRHIEMGECKKMANR